MAILHNSRRIVVQFSFTNAAAIPPSVARRNPETLEERIERKSHSTGSMFIAPTPQCSIADFLTELETEGYELVDAFYKPRIDGKDPRSNRTYHMVRFVFATSDLAKPSDEFKAARETLRAELKAICEGALWRVRSFLNPFYVNGEEVEGQNVVSVNLEAREPLCRPDGQPVTVWQKDADGNRVGNAPLPIAPKSNLHIVDGVITLL